MHHFPMIGDVDAPRDPDLVVPAHIIEKACQRRRAARAAGQAAMQADRQHLGLVQAIRIALGVQHVERVLQVIEELRARIEAAGRGKAHVVGVERVRHHQVRRAAHHAIRAGRVDLLPERQVVAVMVGVVGKAAMLDHEAARVGRVAPRVPALRRRPRQVTENRHGFAQVRALGGFVDVLVRDPAQPVAGDLMAQLLERGHRLGMARQRLRHAEHGQRQLAVLEQAQQAPQAGARAVFVERLHAHVARGEGAGADDLGQEGFGRRIAMQHIVLGAFFVVEHELQRDARRARPLRMGRRAAVAGQVARVGGQHAHSRGSWSTHIVPCHDRSSPVWMAGASLFTSFATIQPPGPGAPDR